MFSKEEASLIKRNFWTKLGQYLALHQSSGGLKVNWINYKTGLKDVYFRMDADKKTAYIGIEIHHADIEIQALFFEQFTELKTYLHNLLEEEWQWQMHYYDEKTNKVISRIFIEQSGFSIFNENHWPELIGFLKSRMIKLDQFWEDAQYSFDALR